MGPMTASSDGPQRISRGQPLSPIPPPTRSRHLDCAVVGYRPAKQTLEIYMEKRGTHSLYCKASVIVNQGFFLINTGRLSGDPCGLRPQIDQICSGCTFGSRESEGILGLIRGALWDPRDGLLVTRDPGFQGFGAGAWVVVATRSTMYVPRMYDIGLADSCQLFGVEIYGTIVGAINVGRRRTTKAPVLTTRLCQLGMYVCVGVWAWIFGWIAAMSLGARTSTWRLPVCS